MTADIALWIGAACGALVGTVATWITIVLGVVLGRHLADRRRTSSRPADSLDTGPIWPTLDADHQRLIERERP